MLHRMQTIHEPKHPLTQHHRPHLRDKRTTPETSIYVCATDEKLNENAFIFPGLGDEGDRILNVQSDMDT